MERIILKNLLENNIYARSIIPFIKPTYFKDSEHSLIFKCINAYYNKYSSFPTYTVIKHAISKKRDLSTEVFNNVIKKVNYLEEIEKEEFHIDWLLDETEQYCKLVAAEKAVIESMQIISDEKRDKYEILKLVEDAVTISFKSDIGIDFFSDKGIQDRWLKYTSPVTKMKSGLTEFDKACGGGIEKKSLNVFLGDTHSGKTTDMCALSAGYVKNGYNVVYITLEMAEEKIAQKHDANFLNVEINDIPTLKENKFRDELQTLKQQSWGKLFIKEFPTSSINALHIKKYIEDLILTEKINIDIVFIDYLNLLLSIRKYGDSTYLAVKMIAEELRGIAVLYDIAIWSGTQTNRGGANNSDIKMTDTSESYGLPATCDLMTAIMGDEELRANNIQVWKIIKNRYSGIIDYRFYVETEYEFGRVIDFNSNKSNIIKDLTNSEKSINMINKIASNEDLTNIQLNINDNDINELDSIFF